MTKVEPGTKVEPEEESAHADTGTSSGRVVVVAWGIALELGCRLIGIFLEAQSMAATVGQVVLVEWGSSRVGVTWSRAGAATAGIHIARRVAMGALFGFGAAAVLFATLMATRAVSLEPVSHVETSVLAFGLVTAVLHAWRDELLHHGIVLRALGDSVPAIGRVLACGVTSAGATLGRGDATPQAVFASMLLGIVFGTLWLKDGGAYRPWAAHVAFRWTVGTLVSGGIVHSQLADNAWAGASAGMLGGTAATVALAPLAVFALGSTAWRNSPRPARVG